MRACFLKYNGLGFISGAVLCDTALTDIEKLQYNV